MFGTLGGPELVLILVLALIVFGPRRLPDIGKSVGRMLAEFRKASNDFKRTIEDEVEAEKQRETTPQIAAPVAEGVSSPVAPAASAPPEAPGEPRPSLDHPAGADLPPGTEGAASDLPPLQAPQAPTFARETGPAAPPWSEDPKEPR